MDYENHNILRYSDLFDSLNARHQQLEDALILSQEWAKQKKQLANFLDESERQLHAFEHILTDAQKMEEQQLLDQLQQATDQQRVDFDRLVELDTELAQMVSLEEGQELDADMHQLITRYDTLGTRLGQIGQLMGTLAEDMVADHFVTDRFVTVHQELCAQTSGAEALSLQFRTDNLRQRAGGRSASRITVLEKALPLAEDLKEGMAELVERLDGVEEDLLMLEEKFQLLNTIDTDLGPAREQLDALHGDDA
ncbi:hypothetical protein niasHT_027723 [Heterodera trifolii]|uniref:Uncharacterized protein n=1 Tax=Heterodera trifolii TaxID=157864 RepID=A0ABD2KBF4_9BILA